MVGDLPGYFVQQPWRNRATHWGVNWPTLRGLAMQYYLPIPALINEWIDEWINPPIHPSIHPTIKQSIVKETIRTIWVPANQPFKQTVKQPVDRPWNFDKIVEEVGWDIALVMLVYPDHRSELISSWSDIVPIFAQIVFTIIILKMNGMHNHSHGTVMSEAWNLDYVFESKAGGTSTWRGSGDIVLTLCQWFQGSRRGFCHIWYLVFLYKLQVMI